MTETLAIGSKNCNWNLEQLCTREKVTSKVFGRMGLILNIVWYHNFVHIKVIIYLVISIGILHAYVYIIVNEKRFYE